MGDADERGDAVALHRARHDHRHGDLGQLVGARLGEPRDAAGPGDDRRLRAPPSGTAGARAGAGGGVPRSASPRGA